MRAFPREEEETHDNWRANDDKIFEECEGHDKEQGAKGREIITLWINLEIESPRVLFG